MHTRASATRRHARQGEQGSALAESVIVMGLLALIIFGILQYAADEHAEQAAQAAASLALAAARAQNGTADQGQAAAEQLLSSLTGAIHDTAVTVNRDARQVTVHVTGRVDTLLGLSQAISVSDAGPVEAFEPNYRGLARTEVPIAGNWSGGGPG